MNEQRDQEILRILKNKAPGTIAIFELKGFYRCYGDDARIVANDILMSAVGIQHAQMGPENMPYQNLNNNQCQKAIRDLLLLLRYRVELYGEGKAANKLVLKKKGVLGNLVDFEDIVSECVELSELSTIMCARLAENNLDEEVKLALAFCNSQDLRIVLAEITDTLNFSMFEQCVVSLQPRECVLIKSNAKNAPNQFKKLEIAVQRAGLQKILIDEEQAGAEKCRDAGRLFHKKYRDLHFTTNEWLALHSLADYMQLLGDGQYEGAFNVMQYGAAGFMYLSNAVLQSLDIFAVDTDIDVCSASPAGPSATLHDHLNRCRCQPGKRLMREWIRRPLFALRQIEERLNVVEAFCKCASQRQILHDDLLRRVPDIALLTRKLVQKKATLQDCYRVYLLIMLLRKIVRLLKGLKDEIDANLWGSVKEMIVEQLQHSIAEFERFVTLIQNTFDLDYYEQNNQHRIKPEIDEKLAEIAAELVELEERAKKVLSKVSNRLDCEVKLESNSQYGFYFRITLKNELALRTFTDHHILDTTKGGGIRFNTKELDRLNDEFRDLLQSYEAGQAELSKQIMETCAGYAPALHSLATRIGTLDVLSTFAIVAASSPTAYVRPTILDKGSNHLELRQCRHPLVERLSGVQYIPNDLHLGENDGRGRFMILTGANMGGKSTYLKAAALTILMAQMGSFVPCEKATFSMVDGIYTRVGAGDFQCKGISTFMAEMMDCAMILEKATAQSLILIDELGRGTSTYDGFGLAWAIAEDIVKRIRCFSLFATHFYEISKLEEKYPKEVKNYKVDTLVGGGKLTLLYQIIPGVAERSFGIDIAKMVGFPRDLVEDAANILQEFECEDSTNKEKNNQDGLAHGSS